MKNLVLHLLIPISLCKQSCDFVTMKIYEKFGAEIHGLDLKTISQDCADELELLIHRHRLVVFKDQELSWQEQVSLTQKWGEIYEEETAVNRRKHRKTPDPRVFIISNDGTKGLTGVGTEGWHVDGSVAPVPHKFTILYCVSPSRSGNTLFAPINEVYQKLQMEEIFQKNKLYFQSKFDSSIIHPLFYRHPATQAWTVMVALGLHGGYLRETRIGNLEAVSPEMNQKVDQLLKSAIESSEHFYSHKYSQGDLVISDNPATTHLASAGSQNGAESEGLRLLRRTTVLGKQMPTEKQITT